jgi:hypothetical protein
MATATTRPAPDEEKRKLMQAGRDASTEKGGCAEGVWWLSVKDKSVSSSDKFENAGWEKVFGLGWAKRPEAHWKGEVTIPIGDPRPGKLWAPYRTAAYPFSCAHISGH